MRVVKRLLREQRGSAAVEFAFIVPILLLMYYGMVEATQALLVDRRVGVVNTTVGDLIAQRPQVKKSDIADIFKISTTILKPFPSNNLGIRVVSIEVNPGGVPTEQWRETHGTMPNPVDLSDIKEKTPGAAFIRAETAYTYQSPLGRIFPQAFVFKHKMDFKPRSSGGAVVRLD